MDQQKIKMSLHSTNIKKAKNIVAVKHGYEDSDDYKFWEDLVYTDERITDEICVEYLKLMTNDFLQKVLPEQDSYKVFERFFLNNIQAEEFLKLNGWRKYEGETWIKIEWMFQMRPYEKMAVDLKTAYETCIKENTTI